MAQPEQICIDLHRQRGMPCIHSFSLQEQAVRLDFSVYMRKTCVTGIGSACS